MSTTASKPTIATMFGEMVWVLSQSPVYKQLKIADLEWMLMPPILLGQYRLFHRETTPLGFALWAYLSDEVERKMQAALAAGAPFRLEAGEWKSGDKLWLIELVCPSATPENQLTEHLLADLVKHVFKDKAFNFHQLQLGKPATQH